VRLDDCTFTAYGGTVAGSLALQGVEGTPATVSLRASGLDVPRTLAALGIGGARVTGSLDGAFRIGAQLANAPERTATAAGTFTVHNGSLGATRFDAFGGDLRIAQRRGSSNRLTFHAAGVDGSGSGTFGFDRTIAYRGTADLDAQAASALEVGVPIAQVAGPIIREALGGARVRVPFTLHGTFDRPQFALAGTPQLVTAAGAAPVVQIPTLPPLPPEAQELLKLIP
jgi:hypothetical protein